MSRRKVMVTGVYGLIGGVVYRHLVAQPERYDVYGLARRRHASDRVAPGREISVPDDHLILSDLSDLAQLTEAFEGMDTVVHMAAKPDADAAWEDVLSSNIVGGYHVFEACRLAGVKRLVYASSVTTCFGYQSGDPNRALSSDHDPATHMPMVTANMAPRPLHLYSSSKVFGEALAHMYSHRHGLSCLCVRIGWVVAEDRPLRARYAPIFCSQRDIAQLIERCVEAPPDLRFDIFFGLSDNRDLWVDISHARDVLDYVPQDHGEELEPVERE